MKILEGFDWFTFLQGLIALVVLGVWATLLIMGREVPDQLNTVLMLVVGFFFGGISNHVARKLRKVI